MSRLVVRTAILAAGIAGCVALATLPAAASGTVGTGGSKAGGRGEYTMGKVITHSTAVCPGCAIERSAFDKPRAATLSANIRAALDGKQPTDAVRSLCEGGDRAECPERLRLVRVYLKRRFQLGEQS